MKVFFTLENGSGIGRDLKCGRIKGFGAKVGMLWHSREKKVWCGYNNLACRYTPECGTQAEARRELEADILATFKAMAEAHP